jgi:ATP-dependent Clp protease protease subunit
MLPPTDERPLTHDELVRQRLFDHRTVVLGGPLDDETAGRVVGELMTLDASGDERVKLLLNSGEGSLDAALMVMDVVDLLGVPVHATCIGRAEGPAVGVLAVASHRAAVRHARLRLVGPPGAFEGRVGDLEAWAEAWQGRVGTFVRRLADVMRRPVSWVHRALREGRYLDANEALRLGLVDEITEPRAASVRPIDRRPGFRPPH